MPNVYKFEKNIPLERLIYYLSLRNYAIDKQVLNYDSKVIGVVAINKQDNTKGFIPCFPSAPVLLGENNLLWMDDVPADTYENTKAFLEQVYKETARRVPCQPAMKVMEDGLIVGILTLTNQFVLLSEPTQDTFANDLPVADSGNYAATDQLINNSDKVDDERVNYMKKIRLETSFYKVFRNTSRHLLGQYQNRDIRREIEEKRISSQLYLKKLQSIDQLLRDLMKNYVTFHPYTDQELLALDIITSCYSECKEKPYCRKKDKADGGTECTLLIPETNLINAKPNDDFYFGKLADEIIRYSRIKSFIFNPKTVLTFSTLKYNLRENEIILLQSLLTQEYFDNIIAAPINRYIGYNAYDTTQPIKAQHYSNVEQFAQMIKSGTDGDDCSAGIVAKKMITSEYWRAVFPLNSREIIFPSQPHLCSFNAILTIIQDYDANSRDLTKNELKEVLIDDYSKLYATYNQQILDMLKDQGKKQLTDQIRLNQLTLANMLISEDYYATILDVWLLALHYNIPLVFISQTTLLQTKRNLLVANSVGNDAYYFLKVSAVVPETAPVYTLTIDDTKNSKIKAADLRNAEIQVEIRKVAVGNQLIKFIQYFYLEKAILTKIRINKPANAVVANAVVANAVVANAVVAPSQNAVVTKTGKTLKLKA